jgi:DNA-binding NarL/FixJ family response regulator
LISRAAGSSVVASSGTKKEGEQMRKKRTSAAAPPHAERSHRRDEFHVRPRNGPCPAVLARPPSRQRPGRVVLVSYAALFRDGLAQLVNSEEDLRVVAVTDEPGDLVRLLPAADPDVVVIHSAPEWKCDQVCQVLDRLPGIGLVWLLPAESVIWGSVPPRHGTARLRLSTAVSGTRFVATVRAAWARSSGAQQPEGTADTELSPREAEVLDLVGAAYTNGQIARQLRISENTVKRHLRSIFRKLHAVSRIDAVNRATALSGNLRQRGAGVESRSTARRHDRIATGYIKPRSVP